MKVFLDCGFYAGKALEYYAPFLDDSWVVYAFEPNKGLVASQQAVDKFDPKPVLIHEAVWIKNGTVDFAVEGREDAAFIADVRAHSGPIGKVKCFDFSTFVSNFKDDDIIVCSMDIEGAEFPVLRKMLKDGTAKRLTLLDVEFHHRLLPNEDEASASQLRRELEGEGVLVKLKIPIGD
jgi:FkbM family methyltransferase